LTVILVAPTPAPFKVRALLIVTLVHEALPEETLIVSPELALLMQVCTLLWSGVVVHVGLEPVQDPLTRTAFKLMKIKRTKYFFILHLP